MKFATAHFPASSVSPATLLLMWVMAMMLIFIATSQLIMYEKFVPFLQNFHLFDSPSFNQFFAAFMVMCEVMALPFLLRMRLSKLLRSMSAACLIITSFTWTFLGYWTITSHLVPRKEDLNSLFSQFWFGMMPLGLVMLVISVIIILRHRRDLV